jgi:hypothetical protein
MSYCQFKMSFCFLAFLLFPFIKSANTANSTSELNNTYSPPLLVDEDKLCSYWAQEGECETSADVLESCAKSCALAMTPPPKSFYNIIEYVRENIVHFTIEY